MARHIRWLIVISLITVFSLWVALPDNTGLHIDRDGDGEPEFSLNVQQSLGLDLVGGLRVLLRSQLPAGTFTRDELQQAANNVSRRINALGISEPTVQIQGDNRILVELPGVTDREQAISTIRQTASLEFVDFSGLRSRAESFIGQRILTDRQVLIQRQREQAQAENGEGVLEELTGAVNPMTGQPFTTVMTGAGLQSAAAQITPAGEWYIQFELTNEGAQVFGPFTGSHIGEPLAIVLDGIVLSTPNIGARLDTGGVIEGGFTEQRAKELALQLRSGALPIPLEVESAETVGASLGQESVNLSIRAGIIGVIVVLMFMVVYYRVPGIAAAFALLIFIVINYALFKLIPVTLTLPAITGFLISIGTAVDGNILIFERIKEELRAGKPLGAALDSGFHRAWQSIRESNLSTIIICAILFLFGQTPGASIVAGFAVTLAIGLVINLFTAVIVTRALLELLVSLLQRPLAERRWLLGA
ncbi:protein translocase subunit SecD [Anaerolineae bacterium CFX9]|nr:protein translocase subunit SecD [Anaerolineae bacterium CFX9]